ncbi:transcriptional regulator [Serratia sp. FGI94]|uniref:transcriptional regulator CynR n=1 Tax=Serratia sp. FGI94 TaxID=671990 RepID=UPI0002A728B1|nr:transcriptional regulator CynR [Serratia sp. FGI94]AGB83258.1 transcriptional regulator [Serratia sp. FGI94]
MLLRHINYFIAVAEHRSFTRAASALHVSQPALSQQIKQLEERLGAPLFDRSGREIQLTDAGQVYLRYAQRALQDLSAGQRAIHDVSDLSRGALRIAVTPTFTSYLVGPLVEAFYQRYPRITLSLREMSQEQMEEQLLDDRLDLGIAFEEVRSTEIVTQRLLVETLALVVGRHHPLAGQRTLGLQQLNNEALILLTAEFATREQIDRYCGRQGIYPRVQMEANSLSAVLEIIRRTPLSTLLPAAVAKEQAGVVAIALEPQLLQRTAVLMQRRGAYQTAAARAFIALAQEKLPDDG